MELRLKLRLEYFINSGQIIILWPMVLIS